MVADLAHRNPGDGDGGLEGRFSSPRPTLLSRFIHTREKISGGVRRSAVGDVGLSRELCFSFSSTSIRVVRSVAGDGCERGRGDPTACDGPGIGGET